MFATTLRGVFGVLKCLEEPNMWTVFLVSGRGALWRDVCFPARRVLAARSGAGGGRVVTRRLCSTDGRTDRSCTVDPNLEEQFVFVDCTEENPCQEANLSSTVAPVGPPADRLQIPPQRHLRSLQHQLQMLRGVAQEEAEPDSLVQFHNVVSRLDASVAAAMKKKAAGESHKVSGIPDVDEPLYDTCCSGCGAVLHCTASTVPGYMPSEKYKVLLQEGGLGRATCQRCHLLTHHHKALSLQMTSDQYRDVLQQVRPLKGLVLLIIDLLDVPDSIVPDLPELIGTNKNIVVLGNKIDLLPADSPNYLQRIKRQLSQYCRETSFGVQVTDIHLISAKTGYGIEGLVSSLQRSWKYKGDVYLVGSANAGKSTLFNTLLESDYCKSKASTLIHKATISPLPGTTLNLLKFPILNPTPYRMFRRQERLNAAARQTESELSKDELKRLRRLSRQGYLLGRVSRTFRSDIRTSSEEIEFDPDSLSFGEVEEETSTASSRSYDEFTFNELKGAHWLFDTPGILKENDILSLLTEQEVMSVVPSRAIIPRTFVLKPGMSLLVGALARIDFLLVTSSSFKAEKSCWFSVLASSRVPVHITSVEKADSVYEKHAGHVLLGVPMGGSKRMRDFPALVPQELRLEGRGYLEAAADIKLSSAGWVAVTAAEGDQLLLRLHGPQAAAFSVRSPPLLPHIISLKGERIRKSAAYRSVKPAGLLDSGVSARGVQRLQVKKKK